MDVYIMKNYLSSKSTKHCSEDWGHSPERKIHICANTSSLYTTQELLIRVMPGVLDLSSTIKHQRESRHPRRVRIHEEAVLLTSKASENCCIKYEM
jgi:hypothetical protein